jgi:hypothetical protein
LGGADIFSVTVSFEVSVCAQKVSGIKIKPISMMNSELNGERALLFSLGKLAREDEFCTGAGFIEQKYVSFRFSVSIGKIQ